MIVTLAAATIVTTNRMLEARRQRDEASFQARRAQASSEFMRNLVTQIGTTPMTMKQVLDRGREALEQQYGHDPAFVARMLILLSGPYVELGEHETASAMTERALEIATKVGDAAMLAGVSCARADGAVEDRKFPEAHAHLAEARRQIARLAAPSSGLVATCAKAESQLADAEERFDEADRSRQAGGERAGRGRRHVEHVLHERAQQPCVGLSRTPAGSSTACACSGRRAT